MKILCSVPKRYFFVRYISTLFQLQVFDFLFNGLILVPKTPLQLTHFRYQDTTIFGTKVLGGSYVYVLGGSKMFPNGWPFVDS